MAKFKFIAADHSKIKAVKSNIGGVLEIRVPLQDGSRQIFRPSNSAGFQPGDLLDNVNDPRAIAALRIDPRFVEV